MAVYKDLLCEEIKGNPTTWFYNPKQNTGKAYSLTILFTMYKTIFKLYKYKMQII